QDVLIVLLACTGFMVLAGKGYDRAAGICLSVCLLKWHLFLFLPLVLAAHRKWKLMRYAGLACLFWLTLSFVEGVDWPIRYAAMLQRPDISPRPEIMPNLYRFI